MHQFFLPAPDKVSVSRLTLETSKLGQAELFFWHPIDANVELVVYYLKNDAETRYPVDMQTTTSIWDPRQLMHKIRIQDEPEQTVEVVLEVKFL